MNPSARADRWKRPAHRNAGGWGLLGCLSLSLAPALAADVDRQSLCITEGAVAADSGELLVDSAQLRGIARLPYADEAQLRFTFLGTTAQQAALGSGASRMQLGLKLRAADPCNLIYVMWRIAPDARVVVQSKLNPGEHTSRECGNRGYRTVKPLRGEPPPAVHAGETHVLHARLQNSELRAMIDGRLVWEGSVADAAGLRGPIGIRSDNVRYRFTLSAGPGQALTGELPDCSREPGAE